MNKFIKKFCDYVDARKTKRSVKPTNLMNGGNIEPHEDHVLSEEATVDIRDAIMGSFDDEEGRETCDNHEDE